MSNEIKAVLADILNNVMEELGHSERSEWQQLICSTALNLLGDEWQKQAVATYNDAIEAAAQVANDRMAEIQTRIPSNKTERIEREAEWTSAAIIYDLIRELKKEGD